MASPSAPARPALTVVMPVYNEASSIEPVLREWIRELDRLRIDYRLAVYDDGSADETPRILERIVRDESRVTKTSQTNRGHGPTILRGYREAEGEWILQIDSDGELPAHGFEDLWSHRNEHDFLLASRHDRRASLARRAVTLGSRLTVWVLFGPGIRDVNSPYRLMRRSRLAPLLAQLPPEPFAPNVLLSALAVRAGLRIYEGSVSHHRRRSGRGSLTSRRLWAGAWRSFTQTVGTAVRARRTRAS
jgi:glycosyltransferase involved in cell wall biosynthesis